MRSAMESGTSLSHGRRIATWFDPGLRWAAMLGETGIREGLEPFGVNLDEGQIGQVGAYLELLRRWNEKINLTSVETDRERVSRHFGESFYLARAVEVCGTMLDVGSGAGFPALALKILFPSIHGILLEPVGKKRAFLKEVCRCCELRNVEVRPERIEEWAGRPDRPIVDASTMRSVGETAGVVHRMLDCLRVGGYLCLWVTKVSSQRLKAISERVAWVKQLDIPLSANRQIWVGAKNESR